jgi:hypothetical protein
MVPRIVAKAKRPGPESPALIKTTKTPMPMENEMTWKIFYSYAHQDVGLRDRLSVFLAPLKREKLISEWYDRKIEPGINWNSKISAEIDTADLILLLITEYFLASDYIFGVEMEKVFRRLKSHGVKVAPILLKDCQWKRSPFSELQIIPRGARPVMSWTPDGAGFNDVANEIAEMVSEPPPTGSHPALDEQRLEASLDMVRTQVRSYARLYERTRDERTRRMEEVYIGMRNIANASFPLLKELSGSPSPGERLAAVAILEAFASEQYFPFLVNLIE